MATGVIFSAERLGMPGRVDVGAIQRFARFFSRWCCGFRIYGYVRPLAAMAPSDYQQRLQMWEAPAVDLEYIYPHYRQRFEKFDKVFGRANVSLRKFSTLTLAGGDVVTDFAGQIGISLDAKNTPRENTGLSREAVALFYALRQVENLDCEIKDIRKLGAAVARTLQDVKGGKLAFDKSLTDPLFEHHAKDITWIENRIGASVSEPAESNGFPIRGGHDFLEIAAGARTALKNLNVPAIVPENYISPGQLLKWVNQGLDAARRC